MMPAVRIELTVPQATYDAIERARGEVPRAAWIKGAVYLRLAAQTEEAPDLPDRP